MVTYDRFPANLYKSSGILRYFPSKLVLEIDQEIVNYYKWFIPKYIYVNRQMHPAHISVVRKEIPQNVQYWGKYEGESLEFEYSNIIHNGQIYYWLNCFSISLERIRQELGLTIDSPYFVPPYPYRKTFHITIGNLKY